MIGKKHDDPESPGYVPSIFGNEPGRRERNSLRWYEAVKRRRAQQVSEAAQKVTEAAQRVSGTEQQVPESLDVHIE